MSNWKTTAVGVFKLAASVVFIGVKLSQHKEITPEDWAIVTALSGGFLGNMFSADAKKDA